MGYGLKVVDSGIVCRSQHRVFSYFAWPSVTRTDDGALLMVCSGLRTAHVDPFGKVVMYRSLDEGKTWGGPHVVIDTALDDRDAGIVNMGSGQLVVSSFNNTREDQRGWAARGLFGTKESNAAGLAYVENVTDDMERRFLGAHVIKSEDNGHTWGPLQEVPISTPHGPTMRRDGTLIFAGTRFTDMGPTGGYPISIYVSSDGVEYQHLSDVPASDDPRVAGCQYSEPHIRELQNGRIVLHIRLDEADAPHDRRLQTLCQSISDDGGKTFSVPKVLMNEGAPPHLLQHSSGAVISAYGRRKPPFGVSVMVSDDNCDTWDMDLPLWQEGQDRDLGYPCSVELPGGDIFTVYYAILPEDGRQASILWTRWRLSKETAV